MAEVRTTEGESSDGELEPIDFTLTGLASGEVMAMCRVCREWIGGSNSTVTSYNELSRLINDHKKYEIVIKETKNGQG